MSRFPDNNAARLIFDPVLGWRRRPGVSYEVLNSLHRKLVIGENGFRVVPGQPEKPDKRIWIFGCSCTEGQWLEDEDTYCYLLQQRFPNWRIEPSAIGGYSTFQNLLQLEANLVTAKPDVVVFTFVPGHPLRNAADPTLWNPLRDGEVERWNLGLGRSFNSFRPAAGLDRTGNLVYRRAFPPKNRDVHIGMMENQADYFYKVIVMTKILQQALELSEQAGAKFYFAVLLSDESVRSNGRSGPDHLKDHPLMVRLKDAGIQIIDADPRLPFEESTFQPVDGHPNAVANLHFARKIGDALEQNAA